MQNIFKVQNISLLENRALIIINGKFQYYDRSNCSNNANKSGYKRKKNIMNGSRQLIMLRLQVARRARQVQYEALAVSQFARQSFLRF